MAGDLGDRRVDKSPEKLRTDDPYVSRRASSMSRRRPWLPAVPPSPSQSDTSPSTSRQQRTLRLYHRLLPWSHTSPSCLPPAPGWALIRRRRRQLYDGNSSTAEDLWRSRGWGFGDRHCTGRGLCVARVVDKIGAAHKGLFGSLEPAAAGLADERLAGGPKTPQPLSSQPLTSIRTGVNSIDKSLEELENSRVQPKKNSNSSIYEPIATTTSTVASLEHVRHARNLRAHTANPTVSIYPVEKERRVQLWKPETRTPALRPRVALEEPSRILSVAPRPVHHTDPSPTAYRQSRAIILLAHDHFQHTSPSRRERALAPNSSERPRPTSDPMPARSARPRRPPRPAPRAPAGPDPSSRATWLAPPEPHRVGTVHAATSLSTR
ncbi:hypothetical protein HU200_008527 [Digitaria exilis]|uniref:Uncharacterized protein n=1 Tax=Digitaria exilis TaxID=1010633 RepID=A0A835FKW9_9POAL|nr:hypothetical protein HU200_008527 [Digitaria exilis]